MGAAATSLIRRDAGPGAPDARSGGGATGGEGPPSGAAPGRAKAFVLADARRLGFDAVGIARAGDVPAHVGERLAQAIADGHHGTMDWLAGTAARRAHPTALWAEVRSIVMVGLNYGPERDPMADLAHPERGVVSVYARGRDYHDVLKGRLKELAQRLVARFGGDVKVFVDTAPVMEKPLAELAGLGWQGKHTNLVSRDKGSWLFLGALFTTLDLEPDAPGRDHCGSCRRCLDVCPTDAFPAPYRLDARRCISYLTIEHKGMIPRAFRRAMGNRIYGCDDCLAVCPWNRFAAAAREAKLAAPADAEAPPLEELARLDDAAFRARFAGSPVKRIGRERFVRNVMIAIGNAADPARFSAVVAERLADASPLVRAAAVWAAGRTLASAERAALYHRLRETEDDPLVRTELEETLTE